MKLSTRIFIPFPSITGVDTAVQTVLRWIHRPLVHQAQKIRISLTSFGCTVVPTWNPAHTHIAFALPLRHAKPFRGMLNCFSRQV